MGDHIFAGPKVDINIADDDSVGNAIFTSLQRLQTDFEILIDGETGVSLTAEELLQHSVGTAVGLQEVGVGRGDVVTIIADTGIAASVASIATWLAGGVMCPMDPSLKTFEFQHMLKVSDPKVIICDYCILEEVQDAMEKLERDVPIYTVNADEDADVLRYEDLFRDFPASDFTPGEPEDIREDLAVIVYSSGSTGLPKGVGLSHYSLALIRDSFGKWTNQAMLQTSYSYWLSGVIMLMTSATNGAPRILLRSTEPTIVLRAIDQYKPNMAILAPSLLLKVLQHPQVLEFDVSSVKLVVVGGSPLQKALYEKKQELMPDAHVIQGYGMTEAAGAITNTTPDVDILSVGRVAPNCEVKIVDLTTQESLGPEQEGEILCKSPSVMKRYVSNEEATSEAFDEDGWYRSGDVGKFTEDGVLYITGRIKELFKFDNHQIAPAEVEGVILNVPGVLDVAVVGIPVGENSLPMALVVKDEDCDLCEDDVIQAVEDNLSEFKRLRAGVHFVNSVARTPTGKLKRRLIQPIAEALYSAD